MAWDQAGLEHPREEETAPTRSFFPAAFCFNLYRQPFLWLTKARGLFADCSRLGISSRIIPNNLYPLGNSLDVTRHDAWREKESALDARREEESGRDARREEESERDARREAAHPEPDCRESFFSMCVLLSRFCLLVLWLLLSPDCFQLFSVCRCKKLT
ncbi:hypothetical protein Taro_002085 [Colocasia esculenta]|uniref:Uncharacterized protein n=1 Tax=Colocasia esculenta TaxID=4460 RepID=A0A843TFE5_COLES|nr:hypothetical protein [Colocasia esculenta]